MSPRSATANEAARDAASARILDAALRQFSAHGYEATSIRRIAEDAGVAYGLVYHYFASKEALLTALFTRSMDDVGATFAVADAAPPDARIATLVRAAAATVRDQLDFWRLSYGLRMQAPVLTGLGPALHAWTSTIQRTLAAYFTDAGSPHPELDAAALFAVIDGVCQHYVLDPDHYPLDAVMDVVIARFTEAP